MSTKVSRVGMVARGLGDLGELVEARVGHADVADVGLDGAEGIVGGLRRRRLRERVEEGGLADVGQAHDAAFEAHGSALSARGPCSQFLRLSASALAALGLALAGRMARGAGAGSSCWLALGLVQRRLRLRLAAPSARAPHRSGSGHRRRRQPRRRIGDGVEQRLQPGRVGLGEVVQHVARAPAPWTPGWPMPMRTRAYSLPMCAVIERRPLWPALPPPVLTLSLPGARSSSSWKTKMSPSSILR